MEFDSLLRLIGEDPVFDSSLLLAGKVNPQAIRLQLTRWVNSGRIIQLRRGLYAIAPPYQKTQPHPFLVANRLHRASYVSLQSALAFHGLIPETVTMTLSVTTGRPERRQTPLGIFDFRHIKTGLFFGYRMTDLGNQNAFVATPEKALLDLVYLQPGSESSGYIQELRLKNLDRLNPETLMKQADAFHSPKIRSVVKIILRWGQGEAGEYEVL